MLAGAQATNLESRIKLASLLFDEVVLEGGEVFLSAGPLGRMVLTDPDPKTTSWPTPRSRARLAAGAGSAIYIGGPKGGGGVRVSQTGPGSQIWVGTYEPLRRALPRGCSWIEFGHGVALTDNGTALVRRIADADEASRAPSPDLFRRNIVVENATTDVLVGAQLGASVSMDRRHAQAATQLLTSGSPELTAQPALAGQVALELAVPQISSLTWGDIKDVRGQIGVRRLRDVLREIEEEAYANASSAPDFERRIRDGLDGRLLEANATAARAFSVGATRAAVSIGLGYIPIMGPWLAAATTGGLELKAAWDKSETWGAVLLGLRRRSIEKRP